MRTRLHIRRSQRVLAAALGAAALAALAPRPAAADSPVIVLPDADARVVESFPLTNFGLSKALLVDTTPLHVESYLRFTVAGISGTVHSATLRLYAYDGSADGPAVAAATTGWLETAVTWLGRPARTSGVLDDAGAVPRESWIELDVSSAVSGDGAYGFVLSPTSDDGVDMYSKEGLHPPQLVVTTASGDTTPPTVGISAPASGGTLTSSQTVTISATAADNDRVDRVEFYDGTTLRATDATSPYSYDWTISSADNGTHTWTAKAHDGTGNSTTSAPVQLTVAIPDQQPPTVAISTPASGGTLTSAQTVTISATAADNDRVDRVELYDGTTLRASDTTSPYSYDWTISGADNGTHTWTARAYDRAGNSTTSAPVHLTVAIPDQRPLQPLSATVETDPVPHSGDAADDPAIWIDAADSARSTIIGTDKAGGLAVYDLSGRELHYYAGGRPNSVDLRRGFALGGREVALVAISDRADNTIGLYTVDPATRGLEGAAARRISTGIAVYGLCLYRSASSGNVFAFVTDKAGTVQQWRLFDDGDGRVDATMVRTFDAGGVVEGCVADDELGHLYVAEEAIGIWKYGAEPDAGPGRTKVDGTGSGGHLTADVEGLALYDGGAGTGYLLASSQGSDTFAVYERQEANTYVTSFAVATGTIDGVSGSDGIDVSAAPLGAGFPHGLFVAQDNTNDSGNQNFKLVPWERVAHVLSPVPPPAAGPCSRPYSDASPWNTPVGPAPSLDPNSAFHVTALHGVLTSDPTQYTYPVYPVTSSSPRRLVTLSGWFSNVVAGGETLLNQRAGTVWLPIPEGAQPAAGSDAQMIMLDPATGDEWGVSNLSRDLLGNWTAWNAYHYNTGWSAVPPRDSSSRPFFARGAGVPYLAGLVRPCEIAFGRIDHALAFAYDFPTGEFIYPATKSDGDSTDPADLPEGARLQLNPALTEDQLRAWACSGPCLTIASALQTYGMYVIDNAGRPKVMMEYEGTADWGGIIRAGTVSPIPLREFRVLDLTP